MSTDREPSADTRLMAWETENGDFVIWGTHSPSVARVKVRQFFRDNIGAEDVEELMPSWSDFRNAPQYWGAPEAPDVDGPWDESLWARNHDEFIPLLGWSPYLVVTQ
ncbi:hypothetical protein ACIQTZ_00425 [Paenarthrobacter sp. NPDC090520]|uniref:hypothetical protein n=1 Tax=Paenarthrobacter sp. NPDC090520 TaxID=3364382 RepID=UPI0037FA14FC